MDGGQSTIRNRGGGAILSPMAGALRTGAFGLVAILILAIGPLLGEEKNLLDNPSFLEKGADPVPLWKTRLIARLTDFRVEAGVLVAERKAGPSTSPDTCFQTVFLPEGAQAVRVTVRASTDRLLDGRLTLSFRDKTWRALGGGVLFHFRGTRPMRVLERDVLLPASTHDAEIAIETRGAGRLLVDEVSVKVLESLRVRDEVRVAEVRTAAVVSSAEARASAQIALPVPPATDTQVPVTLAIFTEPEGRLLSAALAEEDGRLVLTATVGPLPAKEGIRLLTTSRVVLTERPDYHDLPPALPITFGRFLDRLLTPWLTLRTGSTPKLEGVTDLRDAAEKAARGAGGRTPMAVRILRATDIPARGLALVKVGGIEGIRGGFEAYHKEHGWLRFSLDPADARPMSSVTHVVLAGGPKDDTVAPEGVEAEAGVTIAPAPADEGADGNPPAEAAEVACFVLERGAGPDLAGPLGEAWGRAVRRQEAAKGVRLALSDLKFRGKAKKLEAFAADILGEP